ncbi:MAG: response regulator [Candidatus Omnitrophota bacterium]
MEKEHSILCVDDEAIVVTGLEKIFKKEGYAVHSARSAKEGLEILEKEKIDLVMVDQKMPDMSGSQMLKIVNQKYPKVIRILFSGYNDFNGLVDAVNKGEIFRFIQKPWDNEELKHTVRESLSHKVKS